ncbi:pentatricopeptide repeat-containing protein At1g18485 isoform X2 [Argentina anserina]|uniref:pentatricopeptide repeat-containing protein At1g18485 isoform X2 n=1 Tax=Argentina anserina TaxID=57926 RepID=UPI0021765FD9|nr:pentatricopeptide repeat-containing protein At1g18485 isoform X2 [Potentilla anserina]
MLNHHRNALRHLHAPPLLSIPSHSLSTTATPTPPPPHSNLLTLTSAAQTLHQTKQLHALSLLTGLLPGSVSLCASIILRYAAFHSPAACRRLFDLSVGYSRTAFLWNTLIRALSIAQLDDRFQTYNQMVRRGVRLDDHSFPFVIKACSDSAEVKKGLEVHCTVIKLGFDSDVYVGNTLLSFYGSCCKLRDARKVFDKMPEKDVVSWNTVIGVFSVNGGYIDALHCYREMILGIWCMPNVVSVISVLPVCAELANEVVAAQVHCYVVKSGLGTQVTVGNALVDVYGKCWNVRASKQVFDEMSQRNEVSWNSAITSLSYVGDSVGALDMFRSMINVGVRPNSVTISSMLPVLVELELFGVGKELHGFSVKMGIESDVFIGNSLIDMYAKSGHQVEASNVFWEMDERNIVSWNAMIANFAQNRLELEAIGLVRQMQAHGEIPNSVTITNLLPACARLGSLCIGKEIHARTIRTGSASDLFVSNALTDMYAKCGRLIFARNVFNISLRDEVSYNTLIIGYSQTTDCSESLSLFSDMKLVGMMHDIVSFVGVISACANLTAIKQGKEIHGSVIRKHFDSHLFVANSLLDFYTKSGRIDLATKVFDRISNKDVASWNTMILGHGMLVLSSCSHGGLVEKGKRYFEGMLARNIVPEQKHYACMVDLLGRAGLMDETVELIKGMPIVPDANIWGSLLGACRIHGNIELANWAADHLFKLKPDHCGYYILLSNMLAEAGRWEDVKRVRELMKSRGLKKNRAYSWLEVRDEVHAFGV